MKTFRLGIAAIALSGALAGFAGSEARAFSITDSFTFSGGFFSFVFNLNDRRDQFGDSVSPS